MFFFKIVRIRNENRFPLGQQKLAPTQEKTFISRVQTCASVIVVYSIIVFFRVNYLRGSYFHGCTSRLCCCLTTFGKSWVSHLNVAMIKFHAPSDFTNVLIRPPQYHKICGTGDRSVNIVTEILIVRSQLTLRETQIRSLN